MPFITFYDNTIEKYYIHILSKYYSCKKFNLIIELLDEIDTNHFITDNNKKQINLSYINNIKLKKIVDKIIHIKKNKKFIKLNKTFFDLTYSYKLNSNTTKIHTYSNFYYKFKNTELIKIFYNNLINQDESIPDPKGPVNPYNGLTFTYTELSICYMNFILEKNILPLELILFRQSNFSVKNMLTTFKKYFIKKSIQTYIQDMSDKCWFDILKAFYNNNMFENNICYKCLINITNIREILTPTLKEYYYFINMKCNKSNYIIMFKRICSFYKLEEESKHYMKHRAKINKAFKFNNTDINYNFSSNENYLFGK